MSQERKGLPLKANGEIVGTADVVLEDDGSYRIYHVRFDDAETVAKLFDIDYSQFSIAEKDENT